MEIQLLKKHGFSLRAIAREVGCAVNTVRRQLLIGERGERPGRVQGAKRPTLLSGYAGYQRDRQASAHPLWIPATVLFRDIVQCGYVGVHVIGDANAGMPETVLVSAKHSFAHCLRRHCDLDCQNAN